MYGSVKINFGFYEFHIRVIPADKMNNAGGINAGDSRVRLIFHTGLPAQIEGQNAILPA